MKTSDGGVSGRRDFLVGHVASDEASSEQTVAIDWLLANVGGCSWRIL